MLISQSARVSVYIPHKMAVGDLTFALCETVKKLGAMLDCHLTMHVRVLGIILVINITLHRIHCTGHT